MKIKELIAKTPEVSEEKLLEFIDKNQKYLRASTHRRVMFLNIDIEDKAKAILNEYDKIQDKSSYLTKSQREEISGLVSYCMVQMVKADGDRSEDSVGSVSESQETRNSTES